MPTGVRRFVTMGVGFTFLVVGLTGICFQFVFKNHYLMEIHGWLGVAMVAAAVFHIVLNWKLLRSYFRDWRVYFLLVPVLLFMAFFGLAQGNTSQGVNPREILYKLSQAHADDLAKTFGKDVNSVFASMKNDGIQVGDTGETVQGLAQRNQKAPDGMLSYFMK